MVSQSSSFRFWPHVEQRFLAAFIWTVSKKLDIEDLRPNTHVSKKLSILSFGTWGRVPSHGVGGWDFTVGIGTSSQQGRCQQLLWRLKRDVFCRRSCADSLTWHKAEKSLLLPLNRRKVVTRRQPAGERHEHAPEYRTVANRALNKGVELGYGIGLRATETSQTTSRGGK